MIDTWLFVGLVVALAILAYLHRHRLHVQPIIGRFVYITLYRSKVGIGAMKTIAKRFERFLNWATPWIIGLGFFGMAIVTIEIALGIYTMIVNPAAGSGVALVLPLKAKGVFYVPFVYWIISIFAVVLVHEGGHGIMAIVHKVRIKASGLAALAIVVPVVPAAFVEPDEKELQKMPARAQLGVFAAGPMANIFLAILVMGLFVGVTNPVVEGYYHNDGLTITKLAENVTLPIMSSGIKAGEVIIGVDGKPTPDLNAFQTIFKAKKPSEAIALTVKEKAKEASLSPDGSGLLPGERVVITQLGEVPDKKGTPYLGVFFEQARHQIEFGWYVAIVEWINELLLWLAAMNIGVGLFNLLPLGIVDGGRMLHTALKSYLAEERANRAWVAISGMAFVAVLFSIVAGFFK